MVADAGARATVALADIQVIPRTFIGMLVNITACGLHTCDCLRRALASGSGEELVMGILERKIAISNRLGSDWIIIAAAVRNTLQPCAIHETRK